MEGCWRSVGGLVGSWELWEGGRGKILVGGNKVKTLLGVGEEEGGYWDGLGMRNAEWV